MQGLLRFLTCDGQNTAEALRCEQGGILETGEKVGGAAHFSLLNLNNLFFRSCLLGPVSEIWSEISNKPGSGEEGRS